MSKMRTPLILSTALASALLASTAFAQDAAQQKQSAPPQDTTQSQPPANAAGDQQKKSWSDLDTDRNGSLSAGEASALDSMAQIFPKADADGNGELTGEEYKAWLAANGGGKDVPEKKQ